jgi:PAP2 superfamily
VVVPFAAFRGILYMNPAKFFLCIVTASCIAVPASSQDGHGRPAKTYSADVAVAWFELMYDRVKADAISPVVASRRFAIAGVALYESIVPGMPGHASLGGQLNQLASFTPPSQGTQFNWPTVVNATLGRSLELLFTSPGSIAAIASLRNQLSEQLGQGVNVATTTDSVARGEEIANAIAAWASTDGFATFNNCPFTPPVGDGKWVPTGTVLNPLQPCWGQLRPFVVPSGAMCAPPPPPAFSTLSGSAFHTMALEVYDTVNNNTLEHETIAQFWADGGPGHWSSIVSQVLASDSESLAKAAEAYARVGVAIADAVICCWNTKYQYNLIRPVSYIQQNIDPLWTTFIATPAHPEYTSGHSTGSGAASVVLTDLFGVRSFTDATHVVHSPTLNLAPRMFNSFAEAAAEAAQSRLYGGIHYSLANQNGLAQGTCVGEMILATITF